MDKINSITQIIIHAIPSQNMIDQSIFPGALALCSAQPTTANIIPSINKPIYGIAILGPPEVTIACCSDCSSICSVYYNLQSIIRFIRNSNLEHCLILHIRKIIS
jgi:hypothetical protein